MEFRIGLVRAATPAPRGPHRRRAETGFAAWLAPASEAAAMPPAALAVPLPMLDAPDDVAAQQRGGQALDALQDLQLALLGDNAGDALAALQDPWPEAADPRLQAALQQIRIRAAVEQARRGRDAPGK